MFKIVMSFMFLAIPTLLAAQGHSKKIHPDFLKMKAFRTYLTIEGLKKPAHTFWFHYFRDGYGNEIKISSDKVNQASTAKPFPGGFVAGSLPLPNKLPGTSVPTHLTELADALQQRVNQLRGGNIKKVTVRYLGRQGQVSVSERIFYREPRVDQNTFMIQGEYSFVFNEALTEFKHQATGGVGDRLFPDENSKDKPLLVNYVMPANLEGTLSLGAKIYYANEAISDYKSVYRDAEDAVKKSVKDILNGTYTNPLNEILRLHGNSYLPQMSKQQVNIDVSSYLYETTGTNSERSLLTFDVERLFLEPVKKVLKHANGFRVELEIDVSQRKLEYTATSPYGDVLNNQLTLKLNRFVLGNSTYILQPIEVTHPTSEAWDALGVRFENIGPNGKLSGLVSIGNALNVSRVRR